MSDRTYLGDSVYARFDGYQVWVYTDNGYGPNEVREIALDSRTLDALNRFAARCAGPRLSAPADINPQGWGYVDAKGILHDGYSSAEAATEAWREAGSP